MNYVMMLEESLWSVENRKIDQVVRQAKSRTLFSCTEIKRVFDSNNCQRSHLVKCYEALFVCGAFPC